MAQLPDGMIFEFAVDRKGLNIDVEKRDLVYCKHCKYSKEYIDDDTSRRTSLRCEYAHLNLNVADKHFCSAGVIREEVSDLKRFDTGIDTPLG